MVMLAMVVDPFSLLIYFLSRFAHYIPYLYICSLICHFMLIRVYSHGAGWDGVDVIFVCFCVFKERGSAHVSSLSISSSRAR